MIVSPVGDKTTTTIYVNNVDFIDSDWTINELNLAINESNLSNLKISLQGNMERKMRKFVYIFQNASVANSISLHLFQGVFSQVFDLQASDFDNDDSYHREGYVTVRSPFVCLINNYSVSVSVDILSSYRLLVLKCVHPCLLICHYIYQFHKKTKASA